MDNFVSLNATKTPLLINKVLKSNVSHRSFQVWRLTTSSRDKIATALQAGVQIVVGDGLAVTR
jgi:hypothetical protein